MESVWAVKAAAHTYRGGPRDGRRRPVSRASTRLVKYLNRRKMFYLLPECIGFLELKI